MSKLLLVLIFVVNAYCDQIGLTFHSQHLSDKSDDPWVNRFNSETYGILYKRENEDYSIIGGIYKNSLNSTSIVFGGEKEYSDILVGMLLASGYGGKLVNLGEYKEVPNYMGIAVIPYVGYIIPILDNFGLEILTTVPFTMEFGEIGVINYSLVYSF